MPDKDPEWKASLDEALRNARSSDGAKNSLAMLFPKIEAVIGTFVPSSEPDTEVASRRIYNKDAALNYFRLTPPQIAWGRTQLLDILNREPSTALAMVEERIAQHPNEALKLQELFLDALMGLFGSTTPLTRDWLIAILNASPKYISRDKRAKPTFFRTDVFSRLNRIFFKAMSELTDDERNELVGVAIERAQDLSVLTEFFRATVGDKNPGGAESSRPDWFGARTDDLRNRLVIRVRALAENGTIWNQADPGQLIWFWQGSGLVDEVRDFLRRSLNHTGSLLWLLENTVGTVVSTGGNYETVGRSWSKIMDVELLRVHAEKLASGPNSEYAKIARRFIEAFNRAKAGDF